MDKNNSNKKQMYILSNYYCFGNLKDFLMKINLNIDYYWDIIFEMIISIAFIHEIGYIHLDVKPSNYLVNELGELLLNDFSMSIPENESDPNTFDCDGDSVSI